ncbi:MAG: protein kinase domain-containing protein [Anaerolineae bacterium]
MLAERYRILQKVSQRRVSTVYRARDERTGTIVALKQLETVGLVTPAEKRQAIAAFQREAPRLTALRHAHLVSALDYWVERETCYFITSWVDGVTLRQIHDEGPVPEGRARAIGAQIADALAYLHSQQPPLVYRDLKMSHVVVDATGHAYLLDPGITRFFKPGQSRGEAERGTAPYEAPEQESDGFSTPQSDIYALGTLLLALTRGPAGSTPRPLSAELQRMLTVARQKDPAKRYADAATMRDELGGGIPLPAPTPAEPARPGIELLTKRLRVIRRHGKEEAWYRIRVRNPSPEPLTVTVKPAVPWLIAREPEVTVEPGEGAIVIGAHMGMLPHQDLTLAKAVQLSDGRPQWLAVEIVDQEPRLELAQDLLDFGELGDEAAPAPLAVTNAGGGVLEVRLASAVPWLRPARPELAIPGGETQQVAVHVDVAHAPAPGQYPRALRVDSDFGQAWAAVRFGRAQAEMAVEPALLELGDVQSTEPLAATIAISNRGSATLHLKVESGHPALTVTPSRADVPPRYRLAVHVTANVAALAPGLLSVDRAVRFSGNAGSVDVPLRLTVRRPLLAVSEREIDFGTLVTGQVEGARQALVVSNRGNLPTAYRAEVRAPWLQAWPSEGRLEPGSSTVIEVKLTAEARQTPGRRQADDALLLHWDLGSLPVAAAFTLVKPVLAVEPLALDFGVIVAGGVSERTLSIANVGSGTLAWRAETDATWLEAAPATGEVEAGREQSVTVRAYALGLAKEAREAHGLLRLSGPHNSAAVPAAVAVSRPELAVDPIVDLGRSVDLAAVSARAIVRNRGVGGLTGTATSSVPWIDVEPATFTIASGSSLALAVSAAPPPGTSLGRLTLPDVVSVTTNAGAASLEVRLELVADPHIEVTPDRLVLMGDTEGTIIVRNVGLGPFRGKVTTGAAWLKASPSLVTIRPGQRARISVTPEPGREAGALQSSVTIGEGAAKHVVEVILS